VRLRIQCKQATNDIENMKRLNRKQHEVKIATRVPCGSASGIDKVAGGIFIDGDWINRFINGDLFTKDQEYLAKLLARYP
jgi:hypothetical protein